MFEVKKGNKAYNQKHYEALGEVREREGQRACGPVLLRIQAPPYLKKICMLSSQLSQKRSSNVILRRMFGLFNCNN